MTGKPLGLAILAKARGSLRQYHWPQGQHRCPEQDNPNCRKQLASMGKNRGDRDYRDENDYIERHVILQISKLLRFVREAKHLLSPFVKPLKFPHAC